jgi:hypothetical protein
MSWKNYVSNIEWQTSAFRQLFRVKMSNARAQAAGKVNIFDAQKEHDGHIDPL